MEHPSATPAQIIVEKKLAHGPTNPIVARLCYQLPLLLKDCKISDAERAKVIAVLMSMTEKLLSCWEIQQRISAEWDQAKASFDPGQKSLVIHKPTIMNLDPDARNFVMLCKDVQNDVMEVFQLLFPESGVKHWWGDKQTSAAVYARKRFGDGHMNARFFAQCPSCVQPFGELRDASQHKASESGRFETTNTSIVVGKLVEPTWSRVSDKGHEYGPVPILRDMERALHNHLVLAEGVVLMWAVDNLKLPKMTEIEVIPPAKRNPNMPVAYRLKANDTHLQHAIAQSKKESRDAKTTGK